MKQLALKIRLQKSILETCVNDAAWMATMREIERLEAQMEILKENA